MKRKLLLCGVAQFVLTGARGLAGEGKLSPEDILLKSCHVADHITSFQFTELLGAFPDDYDKTTWQEVGDGYRLEEVRVCKTAPANKWRNQNWYTLFSWDGQLGYRLIPDDSRLYIQMEPFDREESDYNASIRGPLAAFEFLLTKTYPREKIQMLAATDYILSVARRTSVTTDKETMHCGHPCIALKVSDGYNRWDNSTADYIAYLATDLDFYPAAWEMHDKQGRSLYSYNVKEFKAIPVPGHEPSVFRYPSLAVLSNSQLPGRYEELTFSNVAINSLTLNDLALDPALADEIEDKDSHIVLAVPK